jgi:hypothetical protein
LRRAGIAFLTAGNSREIPLVAVESSILDEGFPGLRPDAFSGEAQNPDRFYVERKEVEATVSRLAPRKPPFPQQASGQFQNESHQGEPT